MKLHLTKGLLVALMAAAAQSMAAEVNISSLDQTNAILTVPENVTLTAEDTLVVSSGIGFTLGQDITVANLNVGAECNLRPGDYTLTVTDTVTVTAKFGIYDDFSAKLVLTAGSIEVGGSYYTGSGPGYLKLLSGSSLTGGSMSFSSASTLDMGTYLTSTDGLTTVAIESGSYSNGENGYAKATTGYETANLITTGTTLTLNDGSYVKIGDTTYTVDSGVMATFDASTYYVKSGNVSVNDGVLDDSTTSVIVTDGGRADISGTLSADISISGDGEGPEGTYKGAVSLGSGAEIAGKMTVTSEGADIASYGDNSLTGGLQLDGDLTIGKTASYTGNLTIDCAVAGTGGIEVVNGKMTFSANANVATSGLISVAEDGTLTTNSGSTITLSQAISNSGKLVLNGAKIYADELVASASTPATQADEYSEGANGYLTTGGQQTYTIVNNAEDAELTTTNTLVYIGEESYTLGELGTITVGEANTVYFVNSGVVDGSTIDLDFATGIVVADGATLDLSGVATLGDVTLELGAGATIKLTHSVEIDSLTLGNGVIFDVTDWEGFNALDEELFKGVTVMNGSTVVTLQMPDGTTGAASLYLENGVVSIPEPTTATLSLLALAGLAARRRRK